MFPILQIHWALEEAGVSISKFAEWKQQINTGFKIDNFHANPKCFSDTEVSNLPMLRNLTFNQFGVTMSQQAQESRKNYFELKDKVEHMKNDVENIKADMNHVKGQFSMCVHELTNISASLAILMGRTNEFSNVPTMNDGTKSVSAVDSTETITTINENKRVMHDHINDQISKKVSLLYFQILS